MFWFLTQLQDSREKLLTPNAFLRMSASKLIYHDLSALELVLRMSAEGSSFMNCHNDSLWHCGSSARFPQTAGHVLPSASRQPSFSSGARYRERCAPRSQKALRWLPTSAIRATTPGTTWVPVRWAEVVARRDVSWSGP